jgi:hypothetical protein
VLRESLYAAEAPFELAPPPVAAPGRLRRAGLPARARRGGFDPGCLPAPVAWTACVGLLELGEPLVPEPAAPPPPRGPFNSAEPRIAWLP